MDGADDPLELALARCERDGAIAEARARTRVSADIIDDEAVLRGVRAQLEARAKAGGVNVCEAGSRVMARELSKAATGVLRDRLVTTLRDDYDLPAIAAAACKRAKIMGREEQLAYCLVVLCQKADVPRSSSGEPPTRHYRLDVGAADFPEQLRTWADTVAGNLAAWSEDYAKIHDEADRYVTTTLRALVWIDRRDDVASVIAERVSAFVREGERLEDMNLARARAVGPIGREYVFQSRLPSWVRTIATRKAPWESDAFGDAEPIVGKVDEHDLEDDAIDPPPVDGVLDDTYRDLVRRIAALEGTRGVLGAAIERAIDLEARLEQWWLANPDHRDLILRVRAELLHVADRLGEERRAFGGMLAYMLLALRHANTRRRVAILSLRMDALEPEVVEHIATRMRTVVGTEDPPPPSLVTRTASATGDLVRANRLAELKDLRDDAVYRRRRLAELRLELDELAPMVSGVAGIAAALSAKMTPHTVTVTRGQAATELGAVDAMFGRAFRRYAMGVVR